MEFLLDTDTSESIESFVQELIKLVQSGKEEGGISIGNNFNDKYLNWVFMWNNLLNLISYISNQHLSVQKNQSI